MKRERSPAWGNFGRVVAWTVGIVAFAFLVVAMAEIFVPSADEQAVKDTVDAFSEAIADNDGQQACLLLSEQAQAQLMRRRHAPSCQSAAEQTVVKHANWYDFDAVRFGSGHKSALVPVLVPDGKYGLGLLPPITLEQGDGRWVITDLEWYFESF